MKTYKIVSEENIDPLKQQVNNYLTDGFIPIGGLCIEVREGGKTVFHQALYRS